MQSVKDIDEYISKAPKEVQAKLKELRLAIRSVVPNAEERISYGMPYYHYKGRLVYFAYAKKHIGLYALFPDEEILKSELQGYSTSKGTIRFPLDKKMPIALIKKLIKARMRKIEEADKKRPKKIT